jgi:hypothetical protein
MKEMGRMGRNGTLLRVRCFGRVIFVHNHFIDNGLRHIYLVGRSSPSAPLRLKSPADRPKGVSPG